MNWDLVGKQIAKKLASHSYSNAEGHFSYDRHQYLEDEKSNAIVTNTNKIFFRRMEYQNDRVVFGTSMFDNKVWKSTNGMMSWQEVPFAIF